jgi:hypothetical protein
MQVIRRYSWREALNYIIGFENQGNDDATGFTIKRYFT